MDKRNVLIDEFMENLFALQVYITEQIVRSLVCYLDISGFEFKTDNLMQQDIQEHILREFVEWFSVQDKSITYGLDKDDCKRVINFLFYTNI